MGKPNWKDNTIWTGDNLPIMRGMNSSSVDLIYMDPPFNSNVNYAAPIGSPADGAEFSDIFSLDDVKIEWLAEIKAKNPKIFRAIQAAGNNSSKAYLAYMAPRIMQMRRILRDNGSLFLHCDQHMSHYLKVVLDAVFGLRYFRNEIVWRRAFAKGDASKQFGRDTDTIFWYSKSQEYTYNPEYRERDAKYLKPYNKIEEGTGRRYQLTSLTAPGGRGPRYEFLGVTRNWRWTEERMKTKYKEGLVIQTKPGNVPRQKRYLDEQKGPMIDNLWDDITRVEGGSDENEDYPTQKPEALLKRIILAASKKGDVVFDPFCGCATALVVANQYGRGWVGVDLSRKAADLVVERIKSKQEAPPEIHHRSDLPRRNDQGGILRYNHSDNKDYLYGKQGGHCNGCEQHFYKRNLTIDHIIPRSQGGGDERGNLQLLCAACNSKKGTRDMDYLRKALEMDPDQD